MRNRMNDPKISSLAETVIIQFEVISESEQQVDRGRLHRGMGSITQSAEWRLLSSFHDMLERIQQGMQQALKAGEQP